MNPLPRSLPASHGVDPQALVDLLKVCTASPQIELHSIMVMRHGHVLAEGWAHPYRAEHRQLVYSLSKTFSSAAIGLAVADGALGWDERLVDLFPDLADGVGPKASTTRLRDLMCMASGHDRDMVELAGGFRGNLRRPLIGEFLRHEPAGTPGVDFCYNQMCTWTAVRAVHERTGLDVHDILRERVFPALDISGTTWATDGDGRSFGFSGLHITTEHLARFFQLIADDGIADGVQVLDPAWRHELARRHVATGPDADPDWARGYGWQVWMGQHGVRGDGAFGQFALVLPEQQMVVVATSRTDPMQAFLDAVWTHLLPGVDRDNPRASAAQAELDALLADLSIPIAVTGERGGDWKGSDRRGGRVELRETTTGWDCTWQPDPARWDAIPEGPTPAFAVGHGEWVETRLTWQGRSLRVASAGARTGSGHVIDLIVLNSPHRQRLLLQGQQGHSAPQAHVTWWGGEPLAAKHPWELAQPFTD